MNLQPTIPRDSVLGIQSNVSFINNPIALLPNLDPILIRLFF
jgi:hypothetical protein